MTPFTHSLAILIGIDAYTGGIPPLTTAVNDATRLAGLLADAHGYETVLLTQPATGQPVTRERLRALFEDELKARLGEDDRLLVYFAGHGVALDGDDGPRGYLVPQDARPADSASLLAMTDLHAWLTDLPCRHMLAILDCCFAGAFRWAATRHLGALPDVIHKERYDRYLLSPAWQVLTSAAYDQKALDVLDGKTIGVRENDGTPHSPFAQALIDALEKGAADLVPKGQGDGVITATELYLYLREQVEVQAEAQAGHEQTPNLWPLNKHRKGEFIFLAPGHPLNLPPAPDLTAEANPYRGLKSYDQKHAPIFFGREDEIRELVQRVDAAPFLAVLGASGTGKSSLVKAGVLPRLEVRSDNRSDARSDNRSDDFSRPAPPTATQGDSANSEPVAATNTSYRVLPPMRPTDKPLRALAALLRAELGEDLSGLQDLTGLSDVITRWAAAHPGQRLVLAIDQFEELATLCRDDGERERFLRLLANAVEKHPDAFRLIITLRTDFEPQFTQKGAPLAEMWQAGRYVVPPMDIEDLRQVIEGPASVRVLYFDPPELVDDLIKEVIQTPGALPLLSFTLSELYVKYVRSGRDDRALAVADYKALGGVVGSLRNRATEEYDGLPDDAHRLTMQRAMLRMVAVEGGELARRRVALSELDYPTAEENARVQAVLDRLVDARLLVRGTSDPSPGSGQVTDGTKGEAYVEPAHDALVLAWDRLLRWKQEAEEYLPLQRRLAQAAGEWSKATPEAKSGLLWDSDPRLPQVEETLWPTGGKQKGLASRFRWVKQVLAPKTDAPANTKWLNRAELEFAQTSVKQRARDLRRVAGAVTAFVFILVAATIVSLWLQNRAMKAEAIAIEQRDQAQLQARRAKANELSAQSKLLSEELPNRSLLLAIEAANIARNDPPFRLKSVEQTLRDSLDSIGGMQLSSEQSPAGSATYSPDGKWLAAVSNDKQVLLWNASAPREKPSILPLANQLAGPIVELAFSQNGRWLGAVEADESGGTLQRVYVWKTDEARADPRTQSLGQITNAKTKNIALSPDGSIVAIRGSQGFHLWRLDGSSPEHQLLDSLTSDTDDLAFSPDGHWLAGISSYDKKLQVFDITSRPITSRILSDQPDFLPRIKFSNDSRWLAASIASSQARAVQVWSLSDLSRAPLEFRTETIVLDFEFSRDGGNLIVADSDNIGRLWKLEQPLASPVIFEHPQIQEVAVSPDGQLVATGGDDGIVRLWHGTQPSVPLYALRDTGKSPYFGGFKGLEFSHDGRWLLAISDNVELDNASVVWEIAKPLREPNVLLHPSEVQAIAISPDGTQLATGAWDGLVRIWDMGMPATEPTTQLMRNDAISTIAISHDERWLAAAGTTYVATDNSNSTVTVWNLHNLDQPAITLSGHKGPVRALAFSPDDRWMATGSDDNTVRLYRTEWFGAAYIELRGHSNYVRALAFSPDSRLLATGGWDATIRLWDMEDLNSAPKVLKRQGVISAIAFSPDGKWAASVEDKAYLWDARDFGMEPQEMTSARRFLTSVAFSPNSKWLAAGVGNYFAPEDQHETLLWDLENLQGEPIVLRGHNSDVFAAAFTPDGRKLVTGGRDGRVNIYSVDMEDLLATACEEAGRNMTVTEWERYLADEAYRVSCSQFPENPSVSAAALPALPLHFSN